MVSFVCDYCQDTVKKPKLDQHKSRCRNAQFSCIDCSVSFQGQDYKFHTSCISEAEKYQGSTFKGNGGTAVAKTGTGKKNFAKPLSTVSIQDQIKSSSASAAPTTTTASASTESTASTTTTTATTASNPKTKKTLKIIKKQLKKNKHKESSNLHDFMEKCWSLYREKGSSSSSPPVAHEAGEKQEFIMTVLASIDSSTLSLI